MLTHLEIGYVEVDFALKINVAFTNEQMSELT